MPKIAALGGLSSRGFGEFAQQTAGAYIEDVFSTYLYTGNGSSQTITNGIDLAGKGGLVWIKKRTGTSVMAHYLTDSARGVSNGFISTNSTNPSNPTQVCNSFNSNGFGYNPVVDDTGDTIASWTFRKAPKFFDVVTYTGNGTSQNISHNLGSVPGFIIVKNITSALSWATYHRSLGAGYSTPINSTSAALSTTSVWNSTEPTSTQFTVGSAGTTNEAGSTHVAYLFAHNAGGFGADGSQNVISCGSFTTDSSGNATVSLGWEPQFGIFKNSGAASNWLMFDTMRGAPVDGNGLYLQPNTASAEAAIGAGVGYLCPTSTGFQVKGLGGVATIIYLAIRRGPMRTPTSGTSVFTPIAQGTGTNGLPSFPSDAVITQQRSGGVDWQVGDRLRGFLAKYSAWVVGTTTASAWLATNNTNAESTTGAKFGTPPDSVLPFVDNNNMPALVPNGQTNAIYFFKRAPGFFDVVCYTGTGSATTINHNLGVVPELMIVKSRSQAATNWWVYSSSLGSGYYLILNTTDAATAIGSQLWNSTNPTSSVFSIGTSTTINNSGSTYVAYLFASCPGVSKVGTYTGTGATQTISCGFTGGARYVLIKRTDSTGDWWVWDTARGMVSGTDPRLPLNSAVAETNANWVYTTTGGFQIVTSDATVNASGGSYIYLAIA